MFGKITKEIIKNTVNKTNNFLGRAYTETRGLIHSIDGGMNIVKDIYSTLSPYIESYGASRIHNKVTKALDNYDTIRGEVKNVEYGLDDIAGGSARKGIV